ncbi:glycosyltransferase family 10 [Gammaproteobacteria bacterium]|nr:glycosyltransferase family 10 [Gammaproteobacteria bacterium]
MLFGNLVIRSFKNNEIFGTNNHNNSTEPFIALRNALKEHSIEINTEDINIGNKVSFEIHIDKQSINTSNIPIFLFLWEPPNVLPENTSIDIEKYKKIYTWDDKLVSIKKYDKFFLPVTRNNISNIPKFHERTGFCCAISINKAPYGKYKKDLYIERLNTYKWFEKNEPNDFHLYGIGWDRPLKKGIFKNIIISKIIAKLDIKAKNFVNTYKGLVDSKAQVLQKYKYSICYENSYGLNGHVTEKIFDSMFAGCIPVYWGAKNISTYIPEECYIDRRNFLNNKSLYEYLKSIDEKTYHDYQKSINDYFKTDRFNKFSIEYFAKQISTDIIENLKIIS